MYGTLDRFIEMMQFVTLTLVMRGSHGKIKMGSHTCDVLPQSLVPHVTEVGCHCISLSHQVAGWTGFLPSGLFGLQYRRDWLEGRGLWRLR